MQQQGRGIRSFGSKLYKPAKNVKKDPIAREAGKMALNKLPNLYANHTSKIKNKKIKKFLQSDLVYTYGTEYGRQKLG